MPMSNQHVYPRVSQNAVAGPSRIAAHRGHTTAESQDEDEDEDEDEDYWLMAQEHIDDDQYADYPWYE
jgi:hypothetical protein